MGVKAIAGYEGLQPYLDAFSFDHPSADKNVFIAMRFRDGKQFAEIHQTIKRVLAEYGLRGLRADDRVYPSDGDLWNNVCVYMLACKYGVCVFEEIDEREFNPNVPLEYGFMRAIDRQVLLLKDQRMPNLPADMTGKIYHPFDSYEISSTIAREIEKWAEKDLGLRKVGKQSELLSMMQQLRLKAVFIVAQLSSERTELYATLRDRLEHNGYRTTLHDSTELGEDGIPDFLSIARQSRFVIVDITEANHLPQEILALASQMPSVPVQPLVHASKGEWENLEYFRLYRSALERFRLHPSILEPVRYNDQQDLLASLDQLVIAPAEAFIARRGKPPANPDGSIRDI
jgi:hypothetical protein